MRYKGEDKEMLRRNPKQNSKNRLSSDCKLELVYMKSESLVIVNHDVTVNDLSNFAHTAHHARRVVTAGNFIGMQNWIILIIVYLLNFNEALTFVQLSKPSVSGKTEIGGLY